VIAKARGLPPKPEGDEVPPTCHWTLDGLEAELNKEGLAIKRSQIRRLLKAERIKWQKPRTWLESDDPEFSEERGRLSSSIPTRQLAARS
jgi:transposase